MRPPCNLRQGPQTVSTRKGSLAGRKRHAAADALWLHLQPYALQLFGQPLRRPPRIFRVLGQAGDAGVARESDQVVVGGADVLTGVGEGGIQGAGIRCGPREEQRAIRKGCALKETMSQWHLG